MKNLVVLSDGTGNEIGENISNVLKFYRTLRKTSRTSPRQVVFYDPGVGTLARPDPWIKLRQDTVTVLGLMTGYGLDDRVLGAYSFLIDNYEEGDEIYLFGFSRGAYTARVLAALIHKIGLLAPPQRNLADAAMAAYKQSSEIAVPADSDTDRDEESPQPSPSSKDDRAAQFARIASVRWPTIRFMGVWDTVASVIIPRPDRFYTFSLQELPHTRRNPSVRTFRQAIALDERRRMFRLHGWDEPQSFMHNRFSATNNSEPQDVKQVWFAGVHADIGGGYPEAESSLSKFSLLWMIDEAVTHGLAVNRQAINQLAWGVRRKGSPFNYVAPDIYREPHKSLTGAWWPLEWLPKSDRYKEWEITKSRFGYYLPHGEPRPVEANAWVHESVTKRMEAVARYQPVNFPSAPRIVPMAWPS
jgi:uncharacterized protein (DUF2235 family)